MSVCVCQTPHQAPGQPFKFTIPESLDRIKEEFQFLQAQYHRWITLKHTIHREREGEREVPGPSFPIVTHALTLKPHPNHSHPPYHNEQNPNSGLRLTHKPGLGSHAQTKAHTSAAGISVSAYTAVGLSLGDG